MDAATFEHANGVDDCADWIPQMFDDMGRNDKVERGVCHAHEVLCVEWFTALHSIGFEIILERSTITHVPIRNLCTAWDRERPGACAYLETAA